MRKILFWMHLCAGCVAGAVILIMSVTGVALTYEKQMIRWADKGSLRAATQGAAAMLVEDLIAKVRDQKGALPSMVTWRNGASEPVLMSYGRNAVVYADAATGTIVGEGSKGAREFFQKMVAWHRWLGEEGEGRTTGKAITGACNLAFLFIVVSGLYLWFPREWTRRHLAPVIWFRRGLSGRSRDFNWHNAIGFWCLVPLFFIVLSGVVISYPWAGNLVYALTGTEAPGPIAKGGGEKKGPLRDEKKRGRKGEERTGGGPPGFAMPPADLPLDGLNAAFAKAQSVRPTWESITLRLPGSAAGPFAFSVDEGGPGQAHLRTTVTYRRHNGETHAASEYDTFNAGRKVRTWLRFAHTGEVYGAAGQTIAGIASLGGGFLVYTGISLSLRRFAAWRRRRTRIPEPDIKEVAA